MGTLRRNGRGNGLHYHYGTAVHTGTTNPMDALFTST
jgi:hypothetical protein